MHRSVLTISILTLAVAAATVATAQGAPAHRWSIGGAGGLGYTSGPGEALGFAWGLALRRELAQHVALRLGVDGASSASRTLCSGPVPPPPGSQTFCTSEIGASVFSFSLGVDWMARRDRGLFAAGRVGFYSLGDAPGVHPGGYLGAGFAMPLSRAAIILETGVHFYGGRTQQNWVAPALLGLRWHW